MPSIQHKAQRGQSRGKSRSKSHRSAKKEPPQALLPRKDVPVEDQWDLTKLFPSDAAWEKEFTAWQK